MSRRVQMFVLVGAGGFILQLAVVALLTAAFAWPSAMATALGVEAAVLHNFFWHQRWTWRDRRIAGADQFRRLMQFHLTTGVVSIAGNVLVVLVAIHILEIGAVLANVLAVGAISLANYLVADRVVFRGAQAAVMVLGLSLLPLPARAADLTPPTLAAWTRYVATTEAALATSPGATGPTDPVGREERVPGGIIHEWRGSILIPNITVSRLVDALTNPGTPPPQEDVIESRVLARDGDRLRVYLKIVRSAVITVTYETEHEVTFVRHDSQFATSRSVATRISEAGGEDHGFLWRLNSYWQYRQVGTGVRVEVISLSLSRGVPLVVRPLVGGMVSRIARESMTRTLEAVRRFGERLTINPPQRTQSPAFSSRRLISRSAEASLNLCALRELCGEP